MRTRTLATALLLVGSVAVGSPPGPEGDTPPGGSGEPRLRDAGSPDVPLATILDRAGAYVRHYSDTFRGVQAEETCRQTLGAEWVTSSADVGPWGPAGGHQRLEMRTLRSEVVWVAVPDAQVWTAFRDVVEVDGRKLGGHEGRLARLFANPSPAAAAQARTILEESSRHELGARRDVNLPTLALVWLLPGNQHRLELGRTGERTTAAGRAVEVQFREVVRPTLVRDRGRDVASQGRFWIDPVRGAVLGSEIGYEARGSVSTEYRAEPGFDVFVPDVMREQGTYDRARLETTARYAKYCRFAAVAAIRP